MFHSLSFPPVSICRNKNDIKVLSSDRGSDGKESAGSARDPGLIPGLGRSPEEGTGNPLQNSCLEDSTDRGYWWATVHGVTESSTRLSNKGFHFSLSLREEDAVMLRQEGRRQGKTIKRLTQPFRKAGHGKNSLELTRLKMAEDSTSHKTLRPLRSL